MIIKLFQVAEDWRWYTVEKINKITQTNYKILGNKSIFLKSELNSVKSSSIYKDLGENDIICKVIFYQFSTSFFMLKNKLNSWYMKTNGFPHHIFKTTNQEHDTYNEFMFHFPKGRIFYISHFLKITSKICPSSWKKSL